MASSRTALIYPKEIQDTGYFLKFSSYDYSKAQKATAEQNASVGSGLRNLGRSSASFLQGIASSISGAVSGAEDQTTPGLTETAGTSPGDNTAQSDIYLYLPSKLEYNYSAQWNSVSFGALGAAMAASDIGDFLGKAAGIGVVTGGATFADGALEKLANNTIPKTSGVSLDTILGGAFGVVFNDNTLQTFGNMDVRSFNFTYLMVARNQKEEDVIRSIIKTFKKGMHPGARQKGNNATVFLDYPLIWRIMPTIKGNVSNFLPRTKFCALNRLSVDYTPDNVLALTSENFVQAVQISLSFTELEPMTSADVDTFEDPIN